MKSNGRYSARFTSGQMADFRSDLKMNLNMDRASRIRFYQPFCSQYQKEVRLLMQPVISHFLKLNK